MKSFSSSACRHPAKIRKSCDGCALSNIKCGRQHPRCQSCLERGLACSFNQLRGLEKQRASSSKGLAWPNVEISTCSLQYHAPNVTAAEPLSSPSWSEAVTDTCSCGNDKPAFDIPAFVDARNHCASEQKLPVIAGFEYSLNEDIDFNALCASPTSSALFACRSDELSDTALESDGTVSIQNVDEFSARMGDHSSGILSPTPNSRLKTMNPKGLLQGVDLCSKHTRTCMISALKILQTLHMPPSMCLSAGADISDSNIPRPRMTDSVLSTNNEVVRLVSGMLECTCSSSSQVQLVLVIICGKLIAWYGAIIRNGYDGFDNSSSVVWSAFHDHDNINHDDHTERVFHQPFTVGEYSFDVRLEHKVRAQVVFSELQHVEVLIENLSRRVEQTKFGSIWNTAAASSESGMTDRSRLVKPNETALAETVHRNLTVYLHQQLQTVKAEVNLIL